MARTIACLFVAAAIAGHAFADVAKARLGLKAWSAFECSIFAELAKDSKEQERLFALGLEAARSFIAAMRSEEVTKAETDSNVPLAVMLRLGGPSDDFIVGRIYEAAAGDAYDEVVTEDEFGIAMEPSKWRMNEGLKKIVAENKFRSKNCDLIR